VESMAHRHLMAITAVKVTQLQLWLAIYLAHLQSNLR
jgi:hypothetical protein